MAGVGTATSGLPLGVCAKGGAATPVEVAALRTGEITTSWSTSQTAGASYDATYDSWFNSTPATGGQPDCAELMAWLGHGGPV